MTGSRLRQDCSCKLDPQPLDRTISAQGGTLAIMALAVLVLRSLQSKQSPQFGFCAALVAGGLRWLGAGGDSFLLLLLRLPLAFAAQLALEKGDG